VFVIRLREDLHRRARSVSPRELRRASRCQAVAQNRSDFTGFAATLNAVHMTDTQLQKLALEGGFVNSPCTAIF
jgi:hypothetical protein